MAQLKDSVVSGNLRVTDTTLTDTLQVTTIKAPTSSGGGTYGPGTSGQILKSNGSSMYWDNDNNNTYTAGDHLSLSGNTFSVAATAKTITDWNSATTTGWYMGSSVTNAPSTAWWIGRVTAHNTNYVIQEAWQFTKSSDVRAVPHYKRMKTNGTWGSWYDLTVGKAVPTNAVFTDTTYSAGTGLSLSDTTFNHTDSITEQTTTVFKKIKYNSTGHITGVADVTASDLPAHTHSDYVLKAGDTMTGSLSLYTASGDSPALIFKRGTFVDNSLDWKIYDTGGTLTFSQAGRNTSAETWVPVVIHKTESTTVSTIKSLVGVYGQTYGNNAAELISGTAGVIGYGDGGPQIDFSTSQSGAQHGALIFTDHDTAALGASFHFVSTETDWNVISKRFHAKSGISIGTTLPTTSSTLYVSGTGNITGNTSIGGNLGVTGNVSAAKYSTNATAQGYYLKDSSSAEYAGVHDNGTNLWIGAQNSTSYSHRGSVYISTGWDATGGLPSSGTLTGKSTIFISVPTYTAGATSPWKSTSYSVLHTGNLTAGDSNGQIKIAGTNTTIYSHPTYTSKTSGLYKITVDTTGHISATANMAAADVSSLINLLTTGDSNVQLADYFVSQYAGGGTTTTTYHRRPVSKIWNTFKALITIATTGSGNAITSASIANDGDNRKITFTKGSTFALASDIPSYGTVGSANRPVYFSSGTPTQVNIPASGNWFQGIPSVTSGGVLEIGKYIDFHTTSDSTADHDIRMSAETYGLCVDSNFALTTSSGDSPALIFKRGTFTDSLIDWKIYSSSGNLYFAMSTANASTETWTNKVYINGSNGNLYVGSTAVSLEGHTHSNYLGTVKIGSYYGMANPDGTDTSWTRCSKLGLIPYAANSDNTNGNLTDLGSSTWTFRSGFINNLYYKDLRCVELTSETIDGITGSFIFKGNNLIGNTWDWVGLAVNSGADKWQITAENGHMLFRQNDSGGDNTTDWTSWKQFIFPEDVSGSGGITVTRNERTVGTGDDAYAYNTSLTISHSNSITAVTTAAFKKFKYDANGHITGVADVAASDLPSHTHSYAGSSSAGGAATNVNVTNLAGSAAAATYRLTFVSSNGSQALTTDSINGPRYRHEPGTTTAVGVSQIMLGNDTASGTANNAKGMVVFYSENTGRATLQYASTTATSTFNLPAKTAGTYTLATTGDLASYLPLSGGTITSSTFGPLTIERTTTNAGGIFFKNTNGVLGAIGMRNNPNEGLVRWTADTNNSYTILDTSNTSFTQTLTSGTKIGTIKINGTSTDIYCQTNTNTDTKVTQSASTTGNYRPIILGYKNSTTLTDLDETCTDQVYTTETMYAQPSTGRLFSTGYTSNNGNVILKNGGASGASPKIIFQRGTTTDNYLEWAIYNKDGYLYFDRSTTNSETYENKLKLDPSNGNTLEGTLTINGSCKLDGSARGFYLKDSTGTSYPVICDNNTNIWIGAGATDGRHHVGKTYISAGHNGTSGNDTIYVAVPNAGNTSATNYEVFHTGNMTITVTGSGNAITTIQRSGTTITATKGTSFLPLTGGTLSGNVTIEKASGDTGYYAKRTDTNVSVWMGVGSGGTNHGVYSQKLNVWLLYADATTNNVYHTLKNPSSEEQYAISFGGSISAAGYKPRYVNDGLRYATREGTASAQGYGVICVGNNIANGTAGNKVGYFRAYGTTTYYAQLNPGALTANRNIIIPDAAGTMALTSSNITGTAAAWTNARTMTVDGHVLGTVDIKGDANMTLTTVPKNAMYVDNTSDYASYAWHKFAENTITVAYDDITITFLVSRTYGNNGARQVGILSAHVRATGTKTFQEGNLVWNLASTEINPEDFVLVYTETADTSTKVELWHKNPGGQYNGMVFVVLKENIRNSEYNNERARWTMFSVSGHGSATYTSGTGVVTSTLGESHALLGRFSGSSTAGGSVQLYDNNDKGSVISYKNSTRAISAIIRCVPQDVNGIGVFVNEGGGCFVAGAGESTSNIRATFFSSANPYGTAWSYGTESAVLSADSSLYFVSGANSLSASNHTDWTHLKTAIFDSDGAFRPSITGKGTIGTNNYKWVAVYASTLYGNITASGLNAGIYALTETTDPSAFNGAETLITSLPNSSGTSTPNYQRITLDNFVQALSKRMEPVLYDNTTNPTSSATIALPSSIMPKYCKVFIVHGTSLSAGCTNIIDIDLNKSRNGGFIGEGEPGQYGTRLDIRWVYIAITAGTGANTYNIGASLSPLLRLADSQTPSDISGANVYITKVIAVY